MTLSQTIISPERLLNTFFNTTVIDSDEWIVESVHRVLSTINSEMVNPKTLKRDIDKLKEITKRLEEQKLKAQDNSLPIYEVQIARASVAMLKEILIEKTRDVKRRLRGS